MWKRILLSKKPERNKSLQSRKAFKLAEKENKLREYQRPFNDSLE